MKSPICMYSLDWVQIYCTRSSVEPLEVGKSFTSPQNDEHGNHRCYRLTESKEWIKGYGEQYAVMYRQYVVAHIAVCPRNVQLNKAGAAIKLSNAVLYVANWHFILSDILACLEWRAVSLTRVDLCCDFNYFLGGLLPETFIRKYICKSQDSYIRHGSNQFAVYGQKEMHKTAFSSIRWGSRQSGVSVYLYNKTKELDVHKYKPYITNAWVAAKLNPKAVWRVEISINSSGRGLVGTFNHLIHTLFVDALSSQVAIENAFKVYAAQYFKFYKIYKGCPKRKKDLSAVHLLPTETSVQLKPTTLYHSAKSCAAERRTIKMLEALKEELMNEHDFCNLNILVSLDDVIDTFRRRSYYQNMCHLFQIDIKQDIAKGVHDWFSQSDLRNRLLSAKCIREDSAYLQEVAERIAIRIATLAPQGILDVP